MVACELYNSLICFIKNLRDQFEEIEEEAKTLQPSNILYKDEVTRKRKRAKCFDESACEEIVLVGRENFKINTFFMICDKLITELSRRGDAYSAVNDTFNILFVDSLDDERYSKSLKSIEKYYNQDVDANDLTSELINLKKFAIRIISLAVQNKCYSF